MAGATLTALGILLAPPSPPAGTSTAPTVVTTTADPPGPWWHSRTETRVGPTVILPQEIVFDEGDVVVHYQTRDIAPPAIGRIRTLEESNPFFAQPREEPVAAPERWILETVGGEFEGTSPSARTAAARFAVPEGFVLGTVTGLRIESYRMRMPYVHELEIAPVVGSTYRLDEGFSFTVTGVLPQSDSTILHIDYVAPSDSFTAGEPAPVIISGVGPEWVSYNEREAGGMSGGLQLVRRGGGLPDTIRLRVRTTYWIPFETSVEVEVGGVLVG